MSAHSPIRPAAEAGAGGSLWMQIVESCVNLAGGAASDREIAENIRAWARPSERVLVALGALQALTEEEEELVIEAALRTLRGGNPRASFEGLMAEAMDWADVASPAELRAYARATFNALPAKSRRELLKRWISVASIEDRKALFVELWQNFDNATRLDFIEQVDPTGEFRRRE